MTLKQMEKIVYSDIERFMNEFIGETNWDSLSAVYWNSAQMIIAYYKDNHYDYTSFMIRLWDEYAASVKSPKKQSMVMTIDNHDVIAWNRTNKISINCREDVYRFLVQKWFLLASEDDWYSEYIHDTYGSNPEYVKEIAKALNWLVLNTNNRKKDLDAFLRGWLDRWSTRQK